MPGLLGRYWSMAESEDNDTAASIHVTAGRDAYTAGRDLHVHPASPAQADSGERPGTRVDGSAGVQVGSGNFQVNNYYGSETAETAQAAFPALFMQRIIPLHDGLHTGTMLAIEICAQHELEQATVIMTGITGPAGAATIPPPARLYWHPSREASATIAQGASGLINMGRTGPIPFHAVMETPGQDRPWTLPDGQWELQLQLTARRHPALHLTASFSVSPADGFPVQRIEWLTLTAA